MTQTSTPTAVRRSPSAERIGPGRRVSGDWSAAEVPSSHTNGPAPGPDSSGSQIMTESDLSLVTRYDG